MTMQTVNAKVKLIDHAGPDWKFAPLGAKWAAVDKPGRDGIALLWWYTERPRIVDNANVWRSSYGTIVGDHELVHLDGIPWTEACWQAQSPADWVWPETLDTRVQVVLPKQDAVLASITRAGHWRNLCAQYSKLKQEAINNEDDPGVWEDVAELEEQLAQLALELFGENNDA